MKRNMRRISKILLVVFIMTTVVMPFNVLAEGSNASGGSSSGGMIFIDPIETTPEEDIIAVSDAIYSVDAIEVKDTATPCLPSSSSSSGGGPSTVESVYSPITFADVNFETAVREAIGKNTGDILISDVNRIESLELVNKNISDIYGIQYFASLKNLDLQDNNIVNIEILYELYNIENLNLSGNKINNEFFAFTLANLSNLKSLDLSRNEISDIYSFEYVYFENLEELNLNGNQISNIESISGLKKLRVLTLADNKIENIEVLKGFTNLEILDLSNTNISNFSAIKDLINLKKLYLTDNNISNISDLNGLSNLEFLQLNNNNIEDISTISSLENLVVLIIDNNKIKNISALSSLNNLKELNISNNLIDDISYLKNLTKLYVLDVYGNGIENIQPLAELANLEFLYLNSNKISDISPLAKLTKLKELYLSANNIYDIGSLSGLTDLKELDLCFNKISNIDAISSLVNLRGLYLIDNRIRNISNICKLQKLEGLFLRSNEISDITSLSSLKNLEYVDVRYNILGIASNSKSMEVIRRLEQQETEVVYVDKVNLESPINDRNYVLGEKVDIIAKTTEKNISKMELLIDGVKTSEISTTGEFKFTWDTSEVSIGKHTITLVFVDSDENTYYINRDINIIAKIETRLSSSGGGSSSGGFMPVATPTPEPTPQSTEKPNEEVPSGAVVNITDITKNWAKNHIEKLVQKGIVTGYKDNTFKPENIITRAEAVVVISKLFGLKESKENISFKDQIPEWAAGYIKTAIDNGIIKGYADNTFRADNQITREEFTAMFMRAMGKNNDKTVNTNFKDDSNISTWAKGFVNQAIELGLINGYENGTFNPKSSVKRAEVCAVCSKYLDKQAVK